MKKKYIYLLIFTLCATCSFMVLLNVLNIGFLATVIISYPITMLGLMGFLKFLSLDLAGRVGTKVSKHYA